MQRGYQICDSRKPFDEPPVIPMNDRKSVTSLGTGQSSIAFIFRDPPKFLL